LGTDKYMVTPEERQFFRGKNFLPAIKKPNLQLGLTVTIILLGGTASFLISHQFKGLPFSPALDDQHAGTAEGR
jgi:hypothetical protein